MALTGPELVLASASHTAVKFRQLLASLLPYPGVAGLGDLQVTQLGTPGQGVLVAPGGIWLPGTSSSVQGDYYDFNDASLTVNASAADGSQTRIDRLIYRVRDPDYVTGTPPNNLEWISGVAGSGSPPAVPVDSLSLAQIARPINGNTITNGQITDERIFASSLGGGVRGWKQLGPPTTGTYPLSAFGIDGAGAVWACVTAGSPGTWRYVGGGPYYAHAYAGHNQTPTGGSLINVDTIDTDPNGNFNVSTHLYTCPLAGVYEVSWSLEMDQAGLLQASVRQAGSRSTTWWGTVAQTTGTNTPHSSGTALIKASANDTLGLYLEFVTAGNVYAVGQVGRNYLSVKYIGS